MQDIKYWTEGVLVDPEAQRQLRNIAALPILAGHIAVMPDVHVGKGATVGSVIPTRAAIIPSAVGVDIGCGMLAVRTALTADDLPDSLAALRSEIEAAVPVGFDAHPEAVQPYHDGLRGVQLHHRMKSLDRRFGRLELLLRASIDTKRAWPQLGTLGGGNHFIEICLDESEQVWLMLHSGSRNIGNVLATVAIDRARAITDERGLHLADKALAWLDEGTADFDAYVEAMLWAQDYAALNRDLMLHLLCGVMERRFGARFRMEEEIINCHHNYAVRETHFGESIWVTRKGALSARAGELGIIPGSMGARSYIVRGRGHTEAYCSCSHGAGRRLSRGQAKRSYTARDLERQTRGIECRKDDGVIDEIPAAYKDIEAVMAAQSELVEVVATLRQVLCVKG
jgi:tRNA-splicing ligase RtcB